jgi:N6-adenosine-specific RNA methylase IME4
VEQVSATPPYRVIAADPPWAFGDALRMSKVKRGAEANYQGVLDTEAIARLPVRALADEDACLLLWVPDSLLRDGLDVMDAWGFRHTQVWTWVKTGKHEARLDTEDIPKDLAMAFGMGRLGRLCEEHALIGVRGHIYDHLKSHSERTVFLAPNTGHSRKPEKVQDALDRMFPRCARLELFARRQRRAWRCLGNQAPESSGEDIRRSLARLCNAELPPIDPDQIPLLPAGGPIAPLT